MSRRIQIAPSILAADFGRLNEELTAVSDGGADLIHIDVMDGHFVPNLTIGPMIVKAVKTVSQVPLDVHLMINNAERYLETYINAGADILTIHAEAVTHLNSVVTSIQNLGAKPCVVLNPASGLEALDYVLDQLAMVLIMTVNPGFGGQDFIEACLPKIERLRETVISRGLDVDIQVDGGIRIDTIGKAAAAGANVFVSGSGIFNTENYQQTITDLRAHAELHSTAFGAKEPC